MCVHALHCIFTTLRVALFIVLIPTFLYIYIYIYAYIVILIYIFVSFYTYIFCMIVHCSICICRKFFFFICRIMNFYIYLFIYIYISIVYGTFFCSLIIGCCFVTFFTRKAALNAQDALHNVKTLAGVSIIASIFSLYIYICLSICPSIYSFILFLVVFDPFRNLFTLDFLSPNHSVLHILFVHNTSFLFNQDKSLYIYIVCVLAYVRISLFLWVWVGVCERARLCLSVEWDCDFYFNWIDSGVFVLQVYHWISSESKSLAKKTTTTTLPNAIVTLLYERMYPRVRQIFFAKVHVILGFLESI